MIEVIFDPQFSGSRPVLFKNVETLMRKQKFNRVSDETRALLERAGRRGDLVYATHNPYQSEMSAEEGEAVRELMADLDRTRLIERFYQLRDEI